MYKPTGIVHIGGKGKERGGGRKMWVFNNTGMSQGGSKPSTHVGNGGCHRVLENQRKSYNKFDILTRYKLALIKYVMERRM